MKQVRIRAEMATSDDEPEDTTATPIYLLLRQTRKELKKHGSTNLLYQLWATCGKEARDKPNSKYAACLSVLSKASGGQIGLEHLSAAIDFAREKKL